MTRTFRTQGLCQQRKREREMKRNITNKRGFRSYISIKSHGKNLEDFGTRKIQNIFELLTLK